MFPPFIGFVYSTLAQPESISGYRPYTNKKLPCNNKGVFYFVETRGIDVPSKDGGSSGSICIFTLFFRLYF
jgi:hypothetical protein